MSKQMVDTERLRLGGQSLSRINDQINNAFAEMRKSAERLEPNWQSAAGEKAVTTIYTLFRSQEDRDKVLRNYIQLLEQQVQPGYVQAETANLSLADQFK